MGAGQRLHISLLGDYYFGNASYSEEPMNLVLFGGGLGYSINDWLRPEAEVQYGDVAGRLNRGSGVSTYAFGNVLSAQGGLLGSWRSLSLGIGAIYQQVDYAESAPLEAQEEASSGAGAYAKVQTGFGWLVLRSVLRIDPSGNLWFGLGGGGDTAGLFDIL
jgi:hypothetical protein